MQLIHDDDKISEEQLIYLRQFFTILPFIFKKQYQFLRLFIDTTKQLYKQEIRIQILQNLENYGVYWDNNEQSLSATNFKDLQYQLAQQTNPDPIKYEDKVQKFIAQPEDIDILKIRPRLVLIDSQSQPIYRDLWSYASSFWSIPVTVGYGRRIRFLVFDEHNNKLIGIVGLCDPIIGLDIRDRVSIGWTKDQKLERLYNCMTAYILGAIPPYNLVLGGKLIALTLLFPEVQKIFLSKYGDTALDRNKFPYLAYIDTLGAFGKSAIYTKLMNWEFIGYTKGQSHIHITANGSWELIKQLVPENIFNTYKYGDGPNWKIRILKHGLREIGFPEDMLSIGWKRGYYRCPLAENWKDFLVGNTDKLRLIQHKKSELISYWYDRWILPRLDKIQAQLTSDPPTIKDTSQ
ncbi:MAG: Druantia anti-phage system protein DruA [Dolichospermum sp.]|jgi:hypothetical protein